MVVKESHIEPFVRFYLLEITFPAKESTLTQIIGDKGYVSRKISEKLALKGITVTVPLRKNMNKS